MALAYGQADEVARTLQGFLADRARALGAPAPSATIVASTSANSLVVSAADGDMDTIRDLLGRLDQPDVSGDRVTEIVALQEGRADEIARIVRDQFVRRRGGGEPVSVSFDVRTNSIIISAPREQFAQARALIERLDSPAASDETIIRTYALEGARADEVVRILGETLQLDARGQTDGITIKLAAEDEAVEVRAKIVADRRSNSLIVTATEESFPVIEKLISQVDDVPAAIEQEWRIVSLEHAKAFDVYYTLSDFLRRTRRGDAPEARVDYNKAENQLIIAATPDQFEQIERMIEQVDVPSDRKRVTDFVPLKFAEAEKVQEALSFFYGEYAPGAETAAAESVRIVADPATNSLVISAAESEWEAIRALLSELDSEEYDTALQLRVIPLLYADAASVARAINDAFSGTIERNQGRERGRDRGNARPRGREEEGRREAEVPTVLVESEEWVRASAEPQTNSVIISASRPNVLKIEQIIEQLDVADYAKLPPPQLIRVGA
ncbi:MAG: secretin N-terminal domain-containing protein, partial [Planctomycetota bacterium]